MANWYAGNNSTDSGNNTGWFFAAPSANTLTLVLDDITVAATGNTTHNGTISVVLEDVSIAANGSLVHAGTLGLTLDDLTPAISGVVVHNGSLSVSLADIDPIFTGSIGHSGSLAIQLDDVSIVISGANVNAGNLAIALDDIVPQFSGSVTSGNTFRLTLDDITVAFQGPSNQAAGNPARKQKRNYIIQGRRLSLTRSELDAELQRMVLDASETPEKQRKPIEVSVADAGSEQRIEVIDGAFGIQMRLLVDNLERQQFLDAFQRAEALALGPYFEQRAADRRREEEMLLLLLAA